MVTLPPSLVPPTSARLSRLCAGLPLLQQALADAEELKCEKWEVAVTVQALIIVGLSEIDLRWLVSHGLLEPAIEQIRRGKRRRFVFHLPVRAITEQSCFVLTENGRKFAERLIAQERSGMPQRNKQPLDMLLPCWDSNARELTWQGHLVKRFRKPAHCQEIVLNAFEEAKWIARIDNPLPEASGVNPQQRLRDAIRRLNGNQLRSRMEFTRDGTGHGICWQGM